MPHSFFSQNQVQQQGIEGQEAIELAKICKNGIGGFDQNQIQLALIDIFPEDVFIPGIRLLAGSDAQISLEDLKKQHFNAVAFSFQSTSIHQVGIWVDLSDFSLSVLDSYQHRLSEEAIERLQNLFKEKITLCEKTPSYRQEDDWACGVYVIANLMAYSELFPKLPKIIEASALAKEYYRAYKRQELEGLQKEKTIEHSEQIKSTLLKQVEKREVYETLAAYLKSQAPQAFIKLLNGYMQNTDKNNSNTGKDSYAGLLLSITYLLANDSSSSFNSGIIYVISLIDTIKDEARHESPFGSQFSTLLETELSLKLLEEEQSVFLRDLLSILLNKPFEYFFTTLDLKYDVYKTQFKAPEELLMFQALQVVVNRIIHLDSALESERKSQQLAQTARQDAETKRVEELHTILTQAGVSLSEDEHRDLIHSKQAIHFIKQYIKPGLFSDVSEENKKQFIRILLEKDSQNVPQDLLEKTGLFAKKYEDEEELLHSLNALPESLRYPFIYNHRGLISDPEMMEKMLYFIPTRRERVEFIKQMTISNFDGLYVALRFLSPEERFQYALVYSEFINCFNFPQVSEFLTSQEKMDFLNQSYLSIDDINKLVGVLKGLDADHRLRYISQHKQLISFSKLHLVLELLSTDDEIQFYQENEAILFENNFFSLFKDFIPTDRKTEFFTFLSRKNLSPHELIEFIPKEQRPAFKESIQLSEDDFELLISCVIVFPESERFEFALRFTNCISTEEELKRLLELLFNTCLDTIYDLEIPEVEGKNIIERLLACNSKLPITAISQLLPIENRCAFIKDNFSRIEDLDDFIGEIKWQNYIPESDKIILAEHLLLKTTLGLNKVLDIVPNPYRSAFIEKHSLCEPIRRESFFAPQREPENDCLKEFNNDFLL